MHIPDNEGKACDAVVRLLEVQTGDARTDIRHPEKDGVGPPVDLRLRLGAQEYAIEHTRIEPFENQIKTGLVFKQINDCIGEKTFGHIARASVLRAACPDRCPPS